MPYLKQQVPAQAGNVLVCTAVALYRGATQQQQLLLADNCPQGLYVTVDDHTNYDGGLPTRE